MDTGRWKHWKSETTTESDTLTPPHGQMPQGLHADSAKKLDASQTRSVESGSGTVGDAQGSPGRHSSFLLYVSCLGLSHSLSNQTPPGSWRQGDRARGWATYLGCKISARTPNSCAFFISASEGLIRYFPQVKSLEKPPSTDNRLPTYLSKITKCHFSRLIYIHVNHSLLGNSKASYSYSTLGLYYFISYNNDARYIKRHTQTFVQTNHSVSCAKPFIYTGISWNLRKKFRFKFKSVTRSLSSRASSSVKQVMLSLS